MLKRTLFVVGLACTLAASEQPEAQQPAAVTLAKPNRPNETFVRTPDGDWQTTLRTEDGRERPFVFVPPNKVQPRIRTEATLIRDAARRVRYRYEVANGPGAAQEISALFFRGLRQSEVKELPPGWTLLSPPSPGNMTFMGPSIGKTNRGLPPNARAHFVLESEALPGVMQVQSMGATSEGGAVTAPEGLTEKQREELDALSRDVTVDMPAIGPVITTGIGEPELTFSVLLHRTLMHYTVELRRYGHPFADDVIRLANAVSTTEEATLETPNVRTALGELAAISKKDVANAWHRQLSAGLSVCTEALLSGSLPLRGMRGGDE